MVNKALRIMIADSSHAHAWQLERSINRLGYYRVVPVKTLEEVLALSSSVLPPVDVVFINSEIVKDSENGLWNRIVPALRNVMIYSMKKNISGAVGRSQRLSDYPVVSFHIESVSAMMRLADKSRIACCS